MAFYRCIGNSGGGGSSGIKYLVYGEQTASQSNWVQGILPMNTVTSKASDYSSYLSYNSSTKKFTVLKDFTALITYWVLEAWASNNTPKEDLYVNNVAQKRIEANNTAGALDGCSMAFDLKTGDTFWLSNPANQGWGYGRLKVYEITDTSCTAWAEGSANRLLKGTSQRPITDPEILKKLYEEVREWER